MRGGATGPEFQGEAEAAFADEAEFGGEMADGEVGMFKVSG